MTRSERQRRALERYLAEMNTPPGRDFHYRIFMGEASPDGAPLELTLEFLPGEPYCCTALPCHLPLTDDAAFARLHLLLDEEGAPLASPLRVRVLGRGAGLEGTRVCEFDEETLVAFESEGS